MIREDERRWTIFGMEGRAKKIHTNKIVDQENYLPPPEHRL